MTAFARNHMPTSWGQLIWEIKSVNHRYLDASIRLPEQLRVIEEQVRERLAKQISRGKLECTLRFHVEGNQPGVMTVNEDLVDRLTEMANSIEKRIHESSSLSVSDILSWPGVITDEGIDYDTLGASALELLDHTLADLLANFGEWYKDQIRIFSRHGFFDEYGLGALFRVALIAAFAGWVISRFKDSNKKKDD